MGNMSLEQLLLSVLLHQLFLDLVKSSKNGEIGE